MNAGQPPNLIRQVASKSLQQKTSGSSIPKFITPPIINNQSAPKVIVSSQKKKGCNCGGK